MGAGSLASPLGGEVWQLDKGKRGPCPQPGNLAPLPRMASPNSTQAGGLPAARTPGALLSRICIAMIGAGRGLEPILSCELIDAGVCPKLTSSAPREALPHLVCNLPPPSTWKEAKSIKIRRIPGQETQRHLGDRSRVRTSQGWRPWLRLCVLSGETSSFLLHSSGVSNAPGKGQ